ncbi:MAG: patatin-like phospholipase family protein [Acidobacteriota bacterium]
MRRSVRVVVRLVTCLAALSAATASSGQGADPVGAPAHAKLALVLSGGGARGAAHIGALRVLEELHVVPDLVVGTSMGSIVGGLYASGWSPDEIEQLLLSVDWAEMFSDRVVRAERSFRRKQDDVTLLIQGRLRFDGWRTYAPPGAVVGQRLESLLDTIEMRSTTAEDFDDLPIPYRAVAVDLATARPVVIGRGRLSVAMRASMSIPGLFAPVELDGKRLADGGAVANLPVSVARDLGATSIIAVDISSPLGAPGQGFVSVFRHMESMLTQGNVVEDAKNLGPADVYIRPELGDISFLAFDRSHEAVALGEDAVRLEVERLRDFAASEEAWASFQARHRRHGPDALRVDRVRIANSSWVDDRIVHDGLDIPIGQPLDEAALRQQVMDLFALDTFGVIDLRLDRTPTGNELAVTTPAKPYGHSSLQFGVGFADDFSGDTGYTLAVRHLLMAANRRGGEWQNILQGGEVQVLFSEFYQPLDRGQRWFVAPAVEVRRTNQPLYLGGTQIAEYRLGTDRASLALGRVLGNWGEVRLEAATGRDDLRLRIGIPFLPDLKDEFGGVRAAFRVETLDAPIFPREGTRILAWHEQSAEGLGADAEYRRSFVSALHAVSWGGLTLVPYLEVGWSEESADVFAAQFPLGGYGRLSGTARNEFYGDRLILARLVTRWRLARLDLASLRVRAYAGLSLEAGETFDVSESVTATALTPAGSVFVGAETPIGPILLAYGVADGGRHRTYLLIGQAF